MRPHDSQAVEDVIEVAVLVRIDFASALVARVELAGPDAWCCTAIRLGQNHMHRSSSSALRRTLAGLLLDEQTFAAQRRRSWLGHSVATALRSVVFSPTIEYFSDGGHLLQVVTTRTVHRTVNTRNIHV